MWMAVKSQEPVCRPATMMLVAWPRILGPSTCMPTAIVARMTTPAKCTFCWRSREKVRRTAWPKSRDCSPGMFDIRGPVMAGGGAVGRPSSGVAGGLVDGGVAHAAASCCLVWEATISA